MVGNENEGFFYPTLGGVANSIDFYPPPGAEPAHGCTQIGFGMASAVVDGTSLVQHINLGMPDAPIGPHETKMPVQVEEPQLPQHPAPAQSRRGSHSPHTCPHTTTPLPEPPPDLQFLLQALLLHSAVAGVLAYDKYEKLLVKLPPEMALLRTYPHSNTPVAAPEAASEVPITNDVHGEKVILGD